MLVYLLGYLYRIEFGTNVGNYLGFSDGKVLGTILVIVDRITPRIDIITDLGYLDGSFDGYNDGNIEGFFFGYSLVYTDGKVLGSDEDIKLRSTNGKVLVMWLGGHIVVVGWIFVGFGCHATSKGAGLSCELDYTISFWSWILSWKYPHFVEIFTFRGYYPHFM